MKKAANPEHTSSANRLIRLFPTLLFYLEIAVAVLCTISFVSVSLYRIVRLSGHCCAHLRM